MDQESLSNPLQKHKTGEKRFDELNIYIALKGGMQLLEDLYVQCILKNETLNYGQNKTRENF